MASSRINYEVRIYKEEDLQGTLDLFRKHFFGEAPLPNYLQIINDKNPISVDFESLVVRCLKNSSQNLVAVYNGKIIGAMVNSIHHREKVDNLNEAEFKDEKVQLLKEFANYCTRETKLFDKYPDCKKAFMVDYLSVDNTYRGCGIGKALVTQAPELAKTFGCDLVTVNCASYYTARIFEGLGYELIFKQNYEDYIVRGDYKEIDDIYRVNGRIVLRPKKPHTTMRVYAERIS